MSLNTRPPSDRDRGIPAFQRSSTDLRRAWWLAPKNEPLKVAESVFAAVQTIENNQFDTFDRFVKLECLYDPNSHLGDRLAEAMGLVTENVIAQNVDAASAAILAIKTRSVFDTDDADWSVQRRMKQLGYYVEAVGKLLDRQMKCHRAAKSGIKKGTGCLHGYIDQWGRPKFDYVLVDDIIVNERETRNGGTPRQIHRRSIVDRDELIAEYPKHEAEIIAAQKRGSGARWADYRPVEENEVVKVESYRAAIGVKDEGAYIPGRHTICVDGGVLLDEPFEDEDFPILRIVWEEREGGWYGISLTERIAGHQRAINKMNWQTDRQLDLMALPVTYIRPVDAAAGLTAKPTKAGMFVQIRGDYPKTDIPQAVSVEVYNRMDKLANGARELSGLSSMATHGAVPAGLESGVAIREAKGATTDRFAPQEDTYETLNLQADLLILGLCKKLGKKAPVVFRKSRFASKKIDWAKVDPKELKVTISAAGTLARTHAGRIQFVMDLAQTGVISTPTMLKLLDHPDLESELSLYTAAMDVIDEDMEDIAEGNVVMPEPQGNLKLVETRAQETYEKWSKQGAPDGVLEGIRQYMNQAIAYQEMAKPPANDNMGAMPAAGGAPMPGAMPAANANMPVDAGMAGMDPGAGALAAPGVVPPQLRAV